MVHSLRHAQEHVEAPRNTFRERKPLNKFPNYMALMTNIIYFKSSIFQDHWVWRDAMVDEYTSITKNDVWGNVPRSEEKSVVTSTCLYKTKHMTNDCREKYNTWFVVRRFSQNDVVDCQETLAIVTKYTSIRAMMSLVSIIGWRMHQIDVKTMFLNGII